MKRAAILLGRIAVVIVIYLLIARRVSFERMPQLLSWTFYAALATAVLLNLAQAVVCTVRWRNLAGNVEHVPGFVPSFAAYLEGLFFNQALPSFVGGDAVRVLRWRTWGVTTRDAVFSVLRDRLFGAIGAAAVALPACLVLWSSPVGRWSMVVATMLSLAAFCGGIALLVAMQSRRLLRLAANHPRVVGLLNRLRATRLDLRQWSGLFANAVFGHLLSGVSICVLAASLSIQTPALLLTGITGIVLVVTMVPISLAGWGVREASFLALLVPLGVDDERVVLLSVSYGFACLVAALSGGISIMFGLGSRPSEDLLRGGG